MTTHYDVLGVAPAATDEELRRAYLALARRHHPDTGGDVRLMTRLNEAWAVLSDPTRRRRYDDELGVRRDGPVHAGAADDTGPARFRVPFDADPEDLVDTTPYWSVEPKRSLALLPPALFAASVVIGCLALVFDSPEMLAGAAVVFFLSCLSIAAVSLWTLRSGNRHRRR